MKNKKTLLITIVVLVFIGIIVGMSAAFIFNKGINGDDGSNELNESNEVYKSYISIESNVDSSSPSTSVIDMNFEYYTESQQVYITSTEYTDSWDHKYDDKDYTFNMFNTGHQRVVTIEEDESIPTGYYDFEEIKDSFTNLSYIDEESGAGVLEYTIVSDIELEFNQGESVNWTGDVTDYFSITQKNDYTDLSVPPEPVNELYESDVVIKYHDYDDDRTYYLIELDFKYYTETDQVWFETTYYDPSGQFGDTSDWYLQIQTHSHGVIKIYSGEKIAGAYYPLEDAKVIINDLSSIFEGSGYYPERWIVNDIQLVFKEGQAPLWLGSLYFDIWIEQRNNYTVLEDY